MKATEDIMQVWSQFDSFPMETLTKAWYSRQTGLPIQRSVDLMREHREAFGTSGNCFDLAIWLIEAFREVGIPAYTIGYDLGTPHAHVAVVALNERGCRYFCDLGDQWIQPILMDKDNKEFIEEELDGFVTGGKIKVKVESQQLFLKYLRPGGKFSVQKFDLQPIESDELVLAANASQSLLRYPLVEMRIYEPDETVHWEFDRWTSFVSRNGGLIKEDSLRSNLEWAERINARTGIDKKIVMTALDVYSRRNDKVGE